MKRIKDGAAELRQEVLALGLDPIGKSVKEMQQIIAMAKFAEEHPGEEFPDQFDPMLATDTSKADKNWINKVFNSEEWIIQRKANGMRSVLAIYPDGGIKMTSRSRSVKTKMLVPHEEKVLGMAGLQNPTNRKFVLDGELMSPTSSIDTGATVTTSPLQATVALVHMNTEDSHRIQQDVGSLQYHAFDILMYDGKDVQELPYTEREELLNSAVKLIKDCNPDAPLTVIPAIRDYSNAYEVYEEFINNGEEGIMFKRKSAGYQQGKRSKDLVKLKGSITVDGFITGFVPSTQGKGHEDLIGGFEISAYVEGVERVIAAVSNLKSTTRQDATITVDGKPTLNPEFKGKCVEMVGQEFGKNGRLQSARITEWRPDKQPEDCNLTKDDIKEKQWDSMKTTTFKLESPLTIRWGDCGNHKLMKGDLVTVCDSDLSIKFHKSSRDDEYSIVMDSKQRFAGTLHSIKINANTHRIQDMAPEEQTDDVKHQLYTLTQQFVRKYWRQYYPAFKGDINDLIGDFYEQFMTPKSRVKGQEESLLDKYNPEITTLPYLVKVAVKRMLIDRSRSSSNRTQTYAENYDSETGELTLDYLANHIDEQDIAIEDVVFTEEDLLELRDRFDEMSPEAQKSFKRTFKEQRAALSPNFKALFEDLTGIYDAIRYQDSSYNSDACRSSVKRLFTALGKIKVQDSAEIKLMKMLLQPSKLEDSKQIESLQEFTDFMNTEWDGNEISATINEEFNAQGEKLTDYINELLDNVSNDLVITISRKEGVITTKCKVSKK